MSLLEQELLILPEQLSARPGCGRDRVAQALVSCALFLDHSLSFLTIVLCVFFRITASDYSFGIFTLF